MRGTNASISKISRPALTSVFQRTRLFDALETDGKPIVWISGPAGSGKTTFAASYLDATKTQCLWYRVDRNDSNIENFFYYMGIAAKKAAPRFKRPLQTLRPEYLQGIPTFTRSFFEDLYSRLKSPFAIVFDDYQETPETSPLHEIITIGLSDIPYGTRVFILSRNEPPPAHIGLRAGNKIHFIRWDDLRFTLDESKQFTQIAGKQKLTEDEITGMHNTVEGWAAGLVLLMENEADTTTALNSVQKPLQKDVFNYFAREVFNRLDDKTQGFLLRTALLPAIPVNAAEKLAGKGAEDLLETLRGNHFFIELNLTPEPVYRYHSLFRDFLIARIRESFSPEEILLTQRRTASLLEESGQVEHAAELWIECENWDALSALILQNAEVFFNQGRIKTLAGWLTRLPVDALSKSPWLLYWLGMCRLLFDPAAARQHLEEAFDKFNKLNNLSGALLSWSFIIESYGYEFADFTPLQMWIKRLYKLLGAGLSIPSVQIEARVAAGMVFAMATSWPWHADIEDWIKKALKLARECGDQTLCCTAFFSVCLHYALSGENKKFTLLAEEMRNMTRRPGASPFIKAIFIVLEAEIRPAFHIDSDPKEAAEAISAAIEYSARTGIHYFDHLVLWTKAFVELEAGNLEAGDESLRTLEAILDHRQLLRVVTFHRLLAYRAFITGNFSEALARAEKALKISEKCGYVYVTANTHLVMARVLHALKQTDKAQKHIRSAMDLSHGSKLFLFMCLLSQAQFAFDRGKEEEAMILLRQGFLIGREQNYMGLMYWWDPEVMAFLCAKALEAGIETEYVRQLVSRRELIEYPAPVELEGWPWPLKVYTFGEFRIVRDGNNLDFKGKTPQKPLALLKVLICLDHNNIPEEEIADILWPEADGDLAHKSCETTLLRLRNIIGKHAASVNGGLISLHEKYCWTDLRAIRSLLDQAENAWAKAKSARKFKAAVNLTGKIMDIYKGDFLPTDSKESWAMKIRESIKDRVLDLSIKTGKYWQKTGQFEKAIEQYKRGLALDKLAEELYQYLMLCQINLGRRTDAVRTYEKCKAVLSETLAISPSEKTNNIYKSCCDGNADHPTPPA
ncbi:MAG: hypothetical protein KJ826_08090 [Proteobacteria bacterium]|nr:hypothetical protein [Pseudomonadota bacterium]MBU4036083.1 hypothetical protein [Pseudomonadota bacterium]